MSARSQRKHHRLGAVATTLGMIDRMTVANRNITAVAADVQTPETVRQAITIISRSSKQPPDHRRPLQQSEAPCFPLENN